MEELTQLVKQSFSTVKAIHPKNTGADLTFTDQYKNAKSVIPPLLISMLEKAMTNEEIQIKRISARGGTDGATLSFKGLPTADIFAGMFNLHSPLEYADIDIMEASLRTLMSVSEEWTQQSKSEK